MDIPTMQVFRVQDSAGEGPYRKRSANAVMSACDKHGLDYASMHTELPPPWRDLPHFEWRMLDNKNIVCGFKSLGQLVSWFSNIILSELENMGFRVVVYNVPESAVWTGEKQLLFNRKEAQLLETL